MDDADGNGWMALFTLALVVRTYRQWTHYRMTERPVCPTGAAWLDQHVTPDPTTFGAALTAEHRYTRHIVLGAVSDGLRVL